jgi:hypothetical protein
MFCDCTMSASSNGGIILISYTQGYHKVTLAINKIDLLTSDINIIFGL